MKKSKLKLVIRNAIKRHYGDKGLTATADKLRGEIMMAVDKEYNKIHLRKR
jgi:hypothetical protein